MKIRFFMRKKSTLILAFISFFTLSLSAQKDGEKDNRSYIKAGLNIANVTISDDGHIENANNLFSFHAGIVKDLRVAPMLYLQPGVLFTSKGLKSSSGKSTDASYFTATTNPNYIEVPLNIMVKLPINKSKLFFGAGPYGAVAVGGKNKAEGKILGVAFESEKKIKFGDYNEEDGTTIEDFTGIGKMQRFDYGINATIGFEASHMFLSGNYGYGMQNIQSISNSETEVNKHRVISISLGFRL